MPRIIGSIALISLLVAATFGQFAIFAFPVALAAGLIFGIPIALLLRDQGWTTWWFALLGGIACSLPIILFYLSISPGHTSHVGLYNSIYAVGMGAVGGLVFWFTVVFKNDEFIPTQSTLPKSLLLAPLIFAAIFQYRAALEPTPLYGCITDYKLLKNRTVWQYSEVKILTDEGLDAYATMSQGRSNPDVVGNCARISKKRTALLWGFRYSLHHANARECDQACPNQLSNGT